MNRTFEKHPLVLALVPVITLTLFASLFVANVHAEETMSSEVEVELVSESSEETDEEVVVTIVEEEGDDEAMVEVTTEVVEDEELEEEALEEVAEEETVEALSDTEELEVEVMESEVAEEMIEDDSWLMDVAELESGDLFRGKTRNAVYYYGNDGLRYIFPNEKTYFTWEDAFTEIKWISDEDLTTIQIGGNATYKPGIRMVKIVSDPTVYAVSANAELRAIESEEVAVELYGEDWATMVDDLPDYFFTNYWIGSSIEVASQFDVAIEETDATSINDDRALEPFVTIEITEGGYSEPTLFVTPGTTVRFLNSSEAKHSATEWDRIWGSGTLTPGEHYSRTFERMGVWSYYSTYAEQADMSGAIIVE